MKHESVHNVAVTATGFVAFAAALLIGAEWYWWAAFAAIHYYHFMVTGFFLHRYHVHRAFTMRRGFGWAPDLAAISGVLWLSDSPISSFDHHTLHHRFSDTHDDPHGPCRTGWRLLLGRWGKYMPTISAARIAVRVHKSNPWTERPLHRFLEAHFVEIGLTWLFCLALLGWKPLVFIGLLPAASLVISVHALNYFAHVPRAGYQNFTSDQAGISQNLPWLFPVVLGDAWHNNHHAKQRLTHLGGVRWWELDPAAAFWSLFTEKQSHDETAQPKP